MSLQAEIAAHAQLLVHHRRADGEIGELADDGLGVARRFAPADLAGAPAQQLGLGEQGQRAVLQPQALLQRRHGDGQSRVTVQEGLPAFHGRRAQAVVAQAVEQMLAAAGGLGGDQHPARVLIEELHELFGRLGRARLERDIGQAAGGEIDDFRGTFVEAQNLHPAAGGQVPLQFIQSQVELIRRQHRAFEVVPVLVVPGLELLPEVLRGGVAAGQLQEQAVGGQVVQQAGGLLEEQRQIVLDAVGADALADVAIDGAALRIALEPGPPGLAETADGIAVEGELARRQQMDGLDLFDRTLAVRLEGADALDLVVEQVQPVGQFAAHGIDVQQRAAHRELAVLHDLGDTGVAGLLEACPHGLHVQPLADLHRQAAALDVAQRRDPLHQGGDRQDQYALMEIRQPVQGLDTLGDDVLVRREGVVGQGLPVGETEPFQVAAAEPAELALQLLQLRHVGGDQDHRAGVVARRGGQRQRQAVAEQPAPAQARASLRQGRMTGVERLVRRRGRGGVPVHAGGIVP